MHSALMKVGDYNNQKKPNSSLIARTQLERDAYSP